MKKLTRLIAGLSVLAVLMVCMTAVSFAGTAEDKVTVSYRAAEVGSFISLNETLTVQGDLVETNFPDVAEFEPDGVSYLDAIVADHIALYGADKLAENLEVFKSDGYAWINKAYGKSLLATVNNNYYTSSVHDQISDADELVSLIYDDGDYNRTYLYFDKSTYRALPGEDITLKLTANSYGSDYTPDSATVSVINEETGAFEELPAEYKDGQVTVKFTEAGLYRIAAVGKVSYNSWGTDVTTDCYGAYAEVKVGKMAGVLFEAVDAEKFTTIYSVLEVDSYLAEKYFPEIAKYEPEEPSFLDALVAAHIGEYGADKVAEHMAAADAGEYVWVTKAFDQQLLGSVNNKVYTSSVDEPIKDEDFLCAMLYNDGDYNRTFAYFDKEDYTTAVGKTLSLKVSANSYGTDYVPDSATIGTIDLFDIHITDMATKYADGTAKVTFKKAGIYLITSRGKVSYDAWGTPVTTDYMGALAVVTVNKGTNPLTAKGKTVKASSKKKMTFTAKKAFTVKKNQGKVTYKKASGNSKITVSKAGKVTVKKGLKKGKTYSIKVKVTAAGNANYKKGTKTATLKVKITK